MLHHVLFVASPAQIARTKASLARLQATAHSEASSLAESFHLRHQVLEQIELNISLISDLDAITPHLRRHPVDLLIYDEREGGFEARAALHKIHHDMIAFAALWGPDFLFPMSRVVAILNDQKDDATRAFELGRVHVRDVIVAPRSTAQLLRWLARILTQGGVLRSARVGMALSGGGMEGFLYQVGVLHALHRGFGGSRSLRTIDAYSGISSGSICAALLAGNVPTGEIIRAMHSQSDVLPPLTGSLLFDVAAGAIGRRMLKTWMTWAGMDPNRLARNILQAVPTGIFKGEALKHYFQQCIIAYNHEDSFNDLRHELYIGATDQDTFEHVTFGKAPWQHVRISDAMRASCALPPFFTPAQIDGRWFIDGQVTKTCNLELLVERQCRLIFIIDPMKPLGTLVPGSVDERGGLYSVLQTIKALVHTRFHQTLTHITERYPDVDFMVFQPDEECAHLMAGSPMRYRMRTNVVSTAYRHTLRQLRERHTIYSAKLSRFGFDLRPPEELMDLERRDGDILDSIS